MAGPGKVVQGPDGKVIQFPDSMDDNAINQAMSGMYGGGQQKQQTQMSPPKPPASFYNDTALGRGLKAFGLATGGTENASDIIEGPKFAIQHPVAAGKTI